MRSKYFVAALAGATLLGAAPAFAGAKIDFGDGKFVTLGGGFRTDFMAVENAAPDGGTSKDFNLESVRLYTGGQVSDLISFEFNTELKDEDVHILDAVAKFSFSDTFNVWAGRFLPPSDRSNLDGPYYLGTWEFPIAQAFPAIFAGRDNGVAVWGQTGGGKFKYQAGVFEGCRACAANTSDSFLYAGRVVYNFWDPEPGYYNSSDYYGSKDILALGATAQYQSDVTGTAIDQGSWFGWNVDLLMQKKLMGGGVVTVEGSYYGYDADKAPTTLADGDGWFALASYLFPKKVGVGMFQPTIRYEEYDPAGSSLKTKKWEGGINYIIDGHNARMALHYVNVDPGLGGSISSVVLGLQLQL